MAQQIQLRRGPASAWSAINPTLAQGEIGIEIDTQKFKIGDGVNDWNAAQYVSAAPSAYVETINAASGAITIAASGGTVIDTTGGIITVYAPPAYTPPSAIVNTVNGAQGVLTIASSGGAVVNTAGNTITVYAPTGTAFSPSAVAPINYDSPTQTFSISQASTASDGYITASDYTILSNVPTDLAGKENVGVAAGLMSAHTGAADPHPQYVLDTDLISGFTAIPTGSAASAVAATSNSTTYVEAMAATVILSQANVIHGVASANFTALTAAAVAGLRVVVETPEVTNITAVDDVAGSLNSKYFTFNKTSGAFYVWYNVSGGGVDPAPGGTGIPVAIATNATAAQVASATITALATHGGQAVSGYPTQIRIVNAIGGVVTDATAGTSGFTVIVEQQGAATSTGANINQALQNTTDTFNATAQHFYSAPGGGWFHVKAQIQRVSGTGTVNFVRGAIFGQGQQALTNPTNPSRIVYVSKNGSDSFGDGSWSKPYATIGKACTIVQALSSDYNFPYAIAVAPGNGSTTYSETAPISITRGGISIICMGGQGFKPVQTALSGSFIVNMSGSNLFFSICGFEINCPSTANWNTQPASIYVTGSNTQRVFIANAVINSNASTRHAIYCDNANATVFASQSEIKVGTSGTANLVAINMVNGLFTGYNCNTANRQSGNVGQAITLNNNATMTLWGGDVAGSVNKASNTSNLLVYNGTLISSGTNAAIATQASASTGSVILNNAVLTSTATYAVSGSETLLIGLASYTNTSALDPSLAVTVYQSDVNQKFRTAIAGNWATSVPNTVNAAIDRIASQVVALTPGSLPIP